MKKWKHITLEQRKIIGLGVTHNYKVKDIKNTNEILLNRPIKIFR